MERAREVLRDPGQRCEPGEKVAAHRRQQRDARQPHGELADRLGDRARFGRVGERHELLDLVDQDRAPAPSALLEQQPAKIAGVRHQPGGDVLVGDPEARRERGRQRLDRPAPGHERDRGPAAIRIELALGDPRQHACTTQRRLADTGVAGDEDPRLGPQALQHGAHLGVAAEEQPAMLGFERTQTAVRVAFGNHGGPRPGSQPFEGLAQLVTRCRPPRGITREAAVDHRREPGIDVADLLRQRGGIDGGDPLRQLANRGGVVRRPPHAQVIEQHAHRVHVRAHGRRFALPDLGRHVERCTHRDAGRGQLGGKRRRRDREGLADGERRCVIGRRGRVRRP
jgi:hypothetical protein